jgi:hypothetical protein
MDEKGQKPNCFVKVVKKENNTGTQETQVEDKDYNIEDRLNQSNRVTVTRDRNQKISLDVLERQ